MPFTSVGKFVLLALLCAVLAVFYTPKINLVTADLGRHIKNGEIFSTHRTPVTTNYYSYTEPEKETVNHHWGAGVVFYLIGQWFGFKGLSLFHAGLLLASFLLAFYTSARRTCFSLAFLAAVVSIPLITSRLEIRPETFSYLFFFIFYALLSEYRRGRVNRKWLWIIPVLELAWVNTHIFFVFGLLLTALFALDAKINPRNKQSFKTLVGVLGVSLMAACVNPSGIKGLLAPLTIFQDYGYMLAENQSVIFMQKRFARNALYPYFETVFAFSVLSFAFLKRETAREHIVEILLFVIFSALAWKTIRSIALFGFVWIPVVSVLTHELFKQRRIFSQACLVLSLVIFLAGFFYQGSLFRPRAAGGGLYEGVNASAEFFKVNHIQGPIFNNYDIGGFLIYHLFPDTRVFVDNRPEAYGGDFFKTIYVPMQEDENIWRAMDARYGFNAIYFFRHDMTPWAQPFLIRRVNDPRWVPVFVDQLTIILLKRNARNEALINRYALPQRMFQVR